ncbi:hypothetical protein AOR04_04380 [Pseudoalteromonas sp. 1_2015MBL_MicDiv]|nr:hypothetical protein AOR04_04380 [Pseudoalteromonas sp. 1_2015MBL_MicDiv]
MNACKQRVYKTTSNQNLDVDAELARVKSEAFNYLNTHPKNLFLNASKQRVYKTTSNQNLGVRRRACSREKRSF